MVMDIRHYFNLNSDNDKHNSYNDNDKHNSDNDKHNSDNDINNSLKVYEVFTDGSAFNNGQKTKKQYGGIGIYFNNDCFQPISESLSGKITNNIAELKACIKAIDFLINQPDFSNNNHIHIYTDSEYTINCIVKWCKSWEKNGWINKKKEAISNKDLIIILYNYYKKYKIKFIHVKAHKSQPKDTSSIEYNVWFGNNIADKLAREASYNSIELSNL